MPRSGFRAGANAARRPILARNRGTACIDGMRAPASVTRTVACGQALLGREKPAPGARQRLARLAIEEVVGSIRHPDFLAWEVAGIGGG